MKLKQIYTHGFTLIELLVVMAVIGVLAAGLVIIVNPGGQIGRARDAERKSDLSQIQKSLEMYYDDYNRYPDDVTALTENGGNYIQQIPFDPSTDQPYVYIVTTGNQTYRLYTHLESKADSQFCNPNDPDEDCPNAPQGSCGTVEVEAACNYGVTSPNASP
jgi:prepilin-type N-terminal cleavage/methylation domain-containing protein